MTSKDDAFVEAARAFSEEPPSNAPLQETAPKVECLKISASEMLIRGDKMAGLTKSSQTVSKSAPQPPHPNTHQAPLMLVKTVCAICSSSARMGGVCSNGKHRFPGKGSNNCVVSQRVDEAEKPTNLSNEPLVINIPLGDINYPFHLLLGDEVITNVCGRAADIWTTCKTNQRKDDCSSLLQSQSQLQKNCDLVTQIVPQSTKCTAISSNDALSAKFFQCNREIPDFPSSSVGAQNCAISITCNPSPGNCNSLSNNPNLPVSATTLAQGGSLAIASARPISHAKTLRIKREEDYDGCGSWKFSSRPCEHRSRPASIACSNKLLQYEAKNILCCGAGCSRIYVDEETRQRLAYSTGSCWTSKPSPTPHTVSDDKSRPNKKCDSKRKSEDHSNESCDKACMLEHRCYQEEDLGSSSRLRPASSATAAQQQEPDPTIVSCDSGPRQPEQMEGRDLHLRQTVLEEKKPRVPLYPPLDSPDVMVVPENTLYSSQSSAPSFTDRMIGDRNLLHHHREGRLARCGAAHSLYTDNMNPTHTIADLRDTIMALQLQNNELTMCLQQERRRREEAENKIEREKSYIKRLEETIQALKSTRLVIDPSMYRQIAESYMASRQTPVRRTCSSGLQRAGRYEDLVCDSSPERSLPSSPSNSSASQLLRNAHIGTNTHKDSICDSLGSPGLASSSLAGNGALQDSPPSALGGPDEAQELRWPSDCEDSRASSHDPLFQDSPCSSAPGAQRL